MRRGGGVKGGPVSVRLRLFSDYALNNINKNLAQTLSQIVIDIVIIVS